MSFLTSMPGKKKASCLLLSGWFLWQGVFMPVTCSASGMYQVTEEELTRLETNLTRLGQLYSTQKTESARLREQLQRLQEQLGTSKRQLEQAQTSLKTANELLQKYGQEEKSKRLKIKAQRNAWIVTAAAALIFAVVREAR